MAHLPSSASKGSGRSASVASLTAKQTSIQRELTALRSQTDDLDLEADIAFIVKELLECPAKIKEARRAVAGNMFLSNITSTSLHRTLTYMHKVPKWFVEEALTKLDPRLNMQALSKMQKAKQANKLLMHKILYYALMLSPSDRIFAYGDKIFHKVASKRHEELGRPLAKLTLPAGNGEEIDWNTQGFFTLLPAFDSETDDSPKKHKYLQMKDNFTGKIVDLPEHLIVTAAWSVDSKYIYKEAGVVTPKSVRPQWKSRALDLFESLEADYAKKFAPEPMLEALGGALAAQAAEADVICTLVGKGTKRASLADAVERVGVDGMPIRQALTPQEFSSKLARLQKVAKKSSTAA